MATYKESFKNILSIFWAILIAMIIRTFIFEPYSIPSGSMKPNFWVGDYLFVSKYRYGFGNASFPMSPNLWNGRILAFKEPQIGEVIVFKSADDRLMNYIKRLVGLPGDEVQMRNGVLYINNIEVKREEAGEFIDTDGHILQRFKETLPNGASYYVLDDTPYGPLDNTEVYKVPAGHYFFMGDNRDHSGDSRTNGRPIGFVPYSAIIGRAEMIIFSNPNSMLDIVKWPFSFNKERFFKKVDN